MLALWVVGVTTRWLSNIYPWQWRILMPMSAVLEVVAFLIFFQAVASHRPSRGAPKPLESWVFVVIAATLGLLASLVLNLGASIQLALHGSSPAFAREFDQRYLIVSTWGFLVPMVWGFSSRWLPVFMGLRPLRGSLLLVAAGLNTAGVVAGFFERFTAAGVLLLGGAVMAVVAIRFFERTAKAAKTINVHRSFPIFIRVAYGWLLIAAALSIWASRWGGARNLGSIATRFDRWIHRDDGFCRRAENSAVILWDARVMEPDADASDAGAVDDWLHAPRRV